MTLPSSLFVPEAVTFEEALDLSQTLLSQIEQQQRSEVEIEAAVKALVKTENGARGFFVTYLADEGPVADVPSSGVLAGLASSPEIVSGLLVKNLAMSTAMVVYHGRNQDEAMAGSSNRVRSRTARLIEHLQLPAIPQLAQQMLESIETGSGPYREFLQRWRYDAEQKEAIAEAFQPFI